MARKKAHAEYLKLHQDLGDVVRLGPNALSFADPQAIKDIYGLSKRLPKVGNIQDNISKFPMLTGHLERLLSGADANFQGKSPREPLWHTGPGLPRPSPSGRQPRVLHVDDRPVRASRQRDGAGVSESDGDTICKHGPNL